MRSPALRRTLSEVDEGRSRILAPEGPLAKSPHGRAGSDSAKFEIEFYEDENGREPALAFMQSLSAPKRRAIGVALNEVLAHLGANVVGTDYGKNLGGGLYEFRLDQNAEEVLRKLGSPRRPNAPKPRFFSESSFIRMDRN